MSEPRGIELGHGQEFVEDALVRHQPQAARALTILGGEKRFRRRVHLMKLHLGSQQGMQLVRIRRERNATVHEALQLGPVRLQRLGRSAAPRQPLAQDLGDLNDPVRQTGQHGDRVTDPVSGNRLDPRIPVGDAPDAGARFVIMLLRPRREPKRGDAAQLAGMRAGVAVSRQRRQLGRRAAEQVPAVKGAGMAHAHGLIEQGIEPGQSTSVWPRFIRSTAGSSCSKVWSGTRVRNVAYGRLASTPSARQWDVVASRCVS